MVWRLPSHPSEAASCTSTGDHLVCPRMYLPADEFFAASLAVSSTDERQEGYTTIDE